MHSSRMRMARSLIVSPYLIMSHACSPGSNHTCPPGATMHAPLGATMHAPKSNHAHPPEKPCTPPRSNMHAPGSNHACPPGATTHALPEQPCMPPSSLEQPHMFPWEQPCMLPLWTELLTHASENITLPQLRSGR